MTQKKESSRSYELFIDYLFMLIVVINCNSVYNAYKFTSARIVVLIFSLLFLPIVVHNISLYPSANRIRLINFFSIYYILVILFVGIASVYGKGQFLSSFVLFFPMSVLYCYLRFLNGGFFKSVERFSNTVTFFATISLVFWILFSNLHLIPGTVLYSDWSGNDIVNYLWIHFDTQKQDFFGQTFTRNTGIFTEAPMFAYVLLCGLFAELFINIKTRIKIVIVLFITLISTFSTTGIIFATFAILTKAMMRYFRKDKPWRLTFLVVLGIIAVIFMRSVLLQKTGSLSGSIRTDDIHAGIKAWLKSPIVGNGFSNVSAITKQLAPWRLEEGSRALLGFSSGLLQVLNEGGIYLLIIYILPLVNLFRKFNPDGKSKRILIVLALMIGTLIVTITPYNAITLYLLSIMYVYYFLVSDQLLKSNISVFEKE